MACHLLALSKALVPSIRVYLLSAVGYTVRPSSLLVYVPQKVCRTICSGRGGSV